MITSLRRITAACLGLTAVVFLVAAASSNFALCNGILNCVASVNTYDSTLPYTAGMQSLRTNGFSLIAFNETVRVVALYSSLFFLLLLIVLEMTHPHYRTKIHRKRRAAQ